MTYARARLLLGITGVGLWVVVSAGFLALGGASRLPGPDAPFSSQIAVLAVVLGIYAVVSLPLDLLGGVVLPRRHGRWAPGPGRYLAGWLRGVGAQSAVMAGAVALVVGAGRLAGDGAALGVVAVLAVLIGIGRLPIARAVAAIGRPRPWARDRSVCLVDAADPGFTGGLTGLRGRDVMPAAWPDALGPGMAIEVARRRAHAGAPYWLGILVAAAWTVAGAAASLALPGGGSDGVGPMIATGAWFTIWSFAGLLVLPSVSRPAVREADAAVASSWPHPDIARVIGVLDGRQDDEPARPGAIEAIFHPIPGAGGRIRALGTAPRGPRPWNVARLALPMSWCCLGFLGRAVHCNAGRPDLWVMLPTD